LWTEAIVSFAKFMEKSGTIEQTAFDIKRNKLSLKLSNPE